MSRGPGRIERAIYDAFVANPTMTFTVEDLAAIAYPGINRVEKKHRVAVIRAGWHAAVRAIWEGARAGQLGHPVIYYNLLNHRSYAIGRIRCAWYAAGQTHSEIVAAIDDPDEAADRYRWREKARPGSPYWQHVEINRADHVGDTKRAAQLRAAFRAEMDERKAACGYPGR